MFSLNGCFLNLNEYNSVEITSSSFNNISAMIGGIIYLNQLNQILISES